MDYNCDRVLNLGRQATVFLIHRLLSNINDDSDNNEKTKKLKTRVGMFLNTWVGIFQVGISWVRIFRVEVFQGEFNGWELAGWKFS